MKTFKAGKLVEQGVARIISKQIRTAEKSYVKLWVDETRQSGKMWVDIQDLGRKLGTGEQLDGEGQVMGVAGKGLGGGVKSLRQVGHFDGMWWTSGAKSVK